MTSWQSIWYFNERAYIHPMSYLISSYGAKQKKQKKVANLPVFIFSYEWCMVYHFISRIWWFCYCSIFCNLEFFFLLLKEVQKVIRDQNFWVSGNCSSEHIFLEEFSRNWPKMTLSITFWHFVPELLHKLKNLDNKIFFPMAHICSSKQIFRTKN